jgi:hypothetical protein
MDYSFKGAVVEHEKNFTKDGQVKAIVEMIAKKNKGKEERKDA